VRGVREVAGPNGHGRVPVEAAGPKRGRDDEGATQWGWEPSQPGFHS
jgi:hypothetical protein